MLSRLLDLVVLFPIALLGFPRLQSLLPGIFSTGKVQQLRVASYSFLASHLALPATPPESLQTEAFACIGLLAFDVILVISSDQPSSPKGPWLVVLSTFSNTTVYTHKQHVR